MIAEVRDYRRNANTSQPNFDSTYVILKPSNQTLINDVNKLTAGFVPGQQRLWTEEERLSLEANLINSTAEPLCLDPSPLVGIVATNLHYEKKWLKSSSKIRKQVPSQSLTITYTCFCSDLVELVHSLIETELSGMKHFQLQRVLNSTISYQKRRTDRQQKLELTNL